jgi:hypothetical protein
MTPKSIVVVCAANLTSSFQCPNNCRKCFLGGDIAVQWSFNGQGFVQYYPNRESVEQDFEALRGQWQGRDGEAIKAKIEALFAWLLSHNPQGELIQRGKCRFDNSVVCKREHCITSIDICRALPHAKEMAQQ